VDATDLSHRDDLQVLSIGGGAQNADVEIPGGLEAFGQLYGIDKGMYLLRPDLHVCGRWSDVDLSKADAVLAQHMAKGALQ